MDSTGHGQRELVAVEDEVLIASWAINSLFGMRVQEDTHALFSPARCGGNMNEYSNCEILEHCLSRMKAGRRASQRT